MSSCSIRLSSRWIGLFCIVAVVSTAHVQALDPPVGGIRPVANKVVVESERDDLETVLERWTAKAGQIRTLEGKFTRFEFDAPHVTETRGQGVIHFEANGRALYAVEPVPQQPNLRSSRATERRAPFQLQFAKREMMYWLSGQVARINSERNEYEVFEVPEGFGSTAAVEAVDSFDLVWIRIGCLQRQLPGLVEADLAALQQRFAWTLESVNERQIVLSATPLSPAEKRHCSKFVVYLDPQTYMTQGTKLINSTGTRETIHHFTDLRANTVPASNSPDWAPNIGQMNLLTPPPLAPPAVE